MTSALYERYAIGALHALGKERLRSLLDEHFGGRIPQPGTGGWPGFVFAVAPAPLPVPKLPRFPKALDSADHFLPFDVLQPRNVIPFWVGFWSRREQSNPYHHAENRQAWENGRALAQTKAADIYRKYVAECQEACSS